MEMIIWAVMYEKNYEITTSLRERMRYLYLKQTRQALPRIASYCHHGSGT
jgi:hypothetical protein